MNDRAFVPDDFVVPAPPVTPRFRLEPLGPPAQRRRPRRLDQQHRAHPRDPGLP
ncbi:hypothetical protein ACFSTC_44860 [Nonomuraea ferruginea]